LSEEAAELRVQVDRVPNEIDKELERAKGQLYTELNRFRDIKKVDVIRDKNISTGAKGEGAVLELLVTLLASGGVITSFLTFLQSWSQRHNGRKIKIITKDGRTIDATGISPEELNSIIQKNEK
jgi:Effector Associated Constant Component 1